MEMSRNNDPRRKKSPYLEKSCENDKKTCVYAYIINEMQLQNQSLIFFH